MPASSLRRSWRLRAAQRQALFQPMKTRRGTVLNRVSKPRALPGSCKSPLRTLCREIIVKPHTKRVKPSTPSKLPLTELCTSVEEPQLPTSPMSDADIVASTGPDNLHPYHAAHFALSCEPVGPPVARHEQFNRLLGLVSAALDRTNPSASVYVCGTPGTGKTLTVSNVLRTLGAASRPNRTEAVDLLADAAGRTHPEEDEQSGSFEQVWVNCAHLASPRDLFTEVARKLHLPSVASPDAAKDAILKFAQSNHPRVVVVLDEVDFLSSRDQLVLYAAFEWAHLPASRIILIGIANAIDLPIRLLPWLRANRCMPAVVQLAPYTADALTAIVKQRVVEAGDPGLNKVAVSLAAKKVAAGSGDARLVLDVCREAEIALQREHREPLKAISIVSEILNRRGRLTAAVDVIRYLPIQQQLALCVAANAVVLGDEGTFASAEHKKMLNRKATLGGLYDSFSRMSARTKIPGVSFSEFADICSNALMHHGLVEVTKGRSGRGQGTGQTIRSSAVRLRVPLQDVRAGIAERELLSHFLVQKR